FAVALALGEVLVAGVVQRIGPLAGGGIDRERTIGAGGVARVGLGGAVVDVGGLHLAGGRQLRVLGHRARLRAGGDHRAVIGAVDGDGDVLRGDGALVVGHRHREDLAVALALGKVLVAGVVQRIGPLAGGGIDRERTLGSG